MVEETPEHLLYIDENEESIHTLNIPCSRRNGLETWLRGPIRVGVWNRDELYPLFGEDAPLLDDLFIFLQENPQFDCFRCQDEVLERLGNEVVLLWHRLMKCKVPERKCPKRKDLRTHLVENQLHEVYFGQDGVRRPDGYIVMYRRYLMNSDRKVLIWDPIHFRKLSAEHSPIFGLVKEFLKHHKDYEIYSDQEMYMPEPVSVAFERRMNLLAGDLFHKNEAGLYIHASGKVLLWNNLKSTKWYAGRSPLPSNLPDFLRRFPNYEEYKGQDIPHMFRM